MNVTYLDLGPWGAMKRAADELRNQDVHEAVRVSRALAILDEGAANALAAADTGEPVDVVAVLPPDAEDARSAIARAVVAGDLVEISVKGRVVGVLQTRGQADAS